MEKCRSCENSLRRRLGAIIFKHIVKEISFCQQAIAALKVCWLEIIVYADETFTA